MLSLRTAAPHSVRLPTRRVARRAGVCVASAISSQPAAAVADLEVGAKVKVKDKVMVFHVPKAPKEGVNLNGMVGEVAANVEVYKGVTLSANLPYKVTFQLEAKDGAKPFKLTAHLRREELDLV